MISEHSICDVSLQEALRYSVDVLRIPVGVRDAGGFSALHEAAAAGHVRILEELIARGASVNVSSADGIRFHT